MQIKILTASWCSSCKVMESVWGAIQRDFPELLINFIDCSADESPSLLYNVDLLPTVLVVDDNDKEVARLVGTNHKDIVTDFFKKHNFI